MLDGRVQSLPSSKSSTSGEVHPMDIYDKAKQDINGICECMGCYANATSRVSVKVGDKSQITLYLCEKCKPRFNPSSR